jgi:hypothetical protein
VIQAEKLRTAWAAAGARVRDGTNDEAIRAFERKYSVKLPWSVEQYFRCVDGMNAEETDSFDIRFWSLAEVEPVAPELGGRLPELSSGYFAFADYCLWTHAYAFNAASYSSGNVVVIGGDLSYPVAPTFGDFLDLYVVDPNKLLRIGL